MKEIFVIKCSEEDFLKQCKTKTLVIPDDQVYRNCLYVACLDEKSLKINYFTRVSDVCFKEELADNDSIDKSIYHLQIKPGEVLKFSHEIDLSELKEFPAYLTFEEAMSEVIDLKEITKKQKKLTKKEVSLIVARYLEQGINYSVNQKLDDAQDLFNQALDIETKSHLIFFYIGNIFVDKANIDVALYYYRKSIEINPRFHHAYNYLGLAYSYLSKNENSIKCWEMSLSISPNNEFALINLGKAYIQTKQHQKALETLLMAKELNATNLFVFNLIGVACANLGKLDDAIENWSKIIDAGQDDEYLHLNLARAYFESNRYREALEEYELILDMFPKGHDLHNLAEQNIEILREKLSDKTVVINEIKDISPYFEEKFGISLPNVDEELSKLINFNKLSDYIILFSLNELKIKSIVFDKESDEDAIKYDDANQVLQIARGAFKSTIKLRRALKKVKTMVPVKDEEDKKIEEKPVVEENEKEKIKIREFGGSESSNINSPEVQNAIEQAKSLVMMEPKNEWAHYNLGSVLAQAGVFKDASDEFKIASELNPNNAIAWYALGLCFVRMNMLDESIQALQQAIISVPDSKLTSLYEEWNYKDSLAYFGLGDVYIRKGMFDEAIKIFQKGLSIDATSALAHFQLGTCFEVKEQYDLSIESLVNCLSLNPNFSHAYSKLGIVYFKSGLYTESQMMLLKAVGYENPDGESYYYLGEVYMKMDKIEDAKYCYNTVLQISPKDDIFYEKAVKALSDMGIEK